TQEREILLAGPVHPSRQPRVVRRRQIVDAAREQASLGLPRVEDLAPALAGCLVRHQAGDLQMRARVVEAASRRWQRQSEVVSVEFLNAGFEIGGGQIDARERAGVLAVRARLEIETGGEAQEVPQR